MTARRPRVKDGDFLAFIRALPCLICRRDGVEAAHLRYASFAHGKPITGAGTKSDDRWVVPLCPEHHREQHSNGERLWWHRQEIDPLVIAALLYSHYTVDDADAAHKVAISARDVGRGYP